MKLTLKEALRRIRLYFRYHRRMPSYSMLCRMFGFTSKGSAFYLVGRLVEIGYLEKDRKGRISLGKNTLPLPSLGSTKSGYPTEAEEQLIDKVSFDDYLVEHPDDSYLLKVSDDSMIKAGIYGGDLVILDKARKPRQGNIVVVFINNKFTLRFLGRKESGEIFLIAANPKYPVIFPKEELYIEGVVASIVRKYPYPNLNENSKIPVNVFHTLQAIFVSKYYHALLGLSRIIETSEAKLWDW